MKLMSVDIEIADVFELGRYEDIEKYAPFHIAIAATAIPEGAETLWFSTREPGSPEPAPYMTREKAHELLDYLAGMQQDGYRLCSWNGLGFDLKWIGHVAQDMKLAARIALKSYDPMFQFFNQTGYPVGLDAVSKGMKIGQAKSMDAADAPKQWQAGNHQIVMEYVMGDCRLTNRIFLAIEQHKRIRWIAAKGAVREIYMPRLKTVEEVLKDPEPDQSWMKTPLRRSKFCEWALKA
ncbi:MAG TPA: hypothetical protein P5318_05555 [Candidatus Hydrogenedentes bacterium]|nr:hypothetical protein [Candidatus Hydrogenedentota bacterium]HPC15170.1 hypothetical protein [Candidatus Hydrogenedentota bacterium]HRT19575.1 hypothetical protein [Candidatus Hydrogenedentota bacterium]HRT64169.1 hypothetical protein [Candidatus Hydrogenedentota bacterium]